MKNPLTFQRGAWLLGIAMLWAQNAAQACPGCKPVDGAPLSGASIGFGCDICLMLLTIGSLLGGFTYMIFQSCRTLSERDRFLDQDEGMSVGETA